MYINRPFVIPYNYDYYNWINPVYLHPNFSRNTRAPIVGDSNNPNVPGVYGGNTGGGTGVVGKSTSGYGTSGFSDTNVGVYAQSRDFVGVHAKGGRLAGLFEGNVDVTGDLKVSGVDFKIHLQRLRRLEQKLYGSQYIYEGLPPGYNYNY